MRIFAVATIIAMLLAPVPAMAADTVFSADIREADNTTGQNTNTGYGIKTNHIQNNAVTAGKLAPLAVATGKIANGAVTNIKIADSAVNSPKIANGAVINSKIADNAVTDTKITDNAVTVTKISDGAVTGSKLGISAVTSTKIADGSITAAKLSSPLYNELRGSRLNVYDKNGLLMGTVIDSAQDADSPIFGNQLYLLMKTPSGTYFGLRTGSQHFVSISQVFYSGNSCTGSAYSADNYSAYLIQPAHVGFNPSTAKLSAFIQASGTAAQTVLYRSTAIFNTGSNSWVCSNYSSPYQSSLYALTAAIDLFSFIAPFHAGM